MSKSMGENNVVMVELRHELKQWEKSFAEANGNKPGREDIKNDATIFQKYRQYEQLRTKPAKPMSTPRKHARSQELHRPVLQELSPNKTSATPDRTMKSWKDVQGPEVSPMAEATPAFVKCALGPTPQKDGEILGIFDMFPAPTPSKGIVNTGPSDAAVTATPSKLAAPASSENKLSRTPHSSGKRFYLEAFAGTPLKRKREEDVSTPSTAKRQFATPSFLRRSFPLARVDEEDEDTVAAPPFKKRGLVRSLSTIILGLRKQEEQRMDEEMDILDEIEAEERGEAPQPKVAKVLVEDSQFAEMPLGPDQGVESDEESGAADAGALDANGKPRKIWKKKGLKRQTRRVIMRPVTHKAKKAADTPLSDEESGDADGQQADAPSRPSNAGSGQDDDGTYNDGNDPADHDDEISRATAKKKKKTKPHKEPGSKNANPGDEESSKKTKKFGTLAHTNFRKLKIKNKNSKANGRGRFGRR